MGEAVSYTSSPYKEFGIKASAVLTQRPSVKRLDRNLYDHNEPLMPKYGHKFMTMMGHGLVCYRCKGPIFIVQDKKCRGRI